MDKPPRIHRKRGRSRIGNRTSFQKSVKALSVNLWSLPQEVLLHIVQNLHVKELLNLIATHPYFRDLLSSNPSIWQNVSYHGTWPTVPNMKHFMRAAEHSNIEALVKLGVAFLYNEGLPGDFEGKKITTNGERAAEMFCRVEVSTPSVSPFTWLFIRPPWAMGGACCKECVFNNMKDFVSQTPDPSIHICIAKIMGILGIDDYKDDIEKHLTLAKNLGSSEAAFLLWTHKYCQCCRVLDCASNLEGLRDLRQIAMKGYYEAQLALSKRYVSGKYGGIGKKAAATFVQNFIQSSEPTCIREIYRFNELTHSMRYILMDWLVEVACMKDFSSLTLHMAISVVDRFLLKHKTTRATLQLLGVAAMVLCSRVLGTEIITIREAAWLTDNTYKYEDVVRMMGEITATLGGKFRVPVALDYVSVLCELAAVDTETSYLAEYFCELALLQSSLGDFSRAHVAAATLLMARIVRKHENPWPAKMHEFTGFQAADLNKSMLLIHDKCFMDSAMVDHRDVVLQAVKERFADEDFMFVSNIKIMSKADFCTVLGVPVEPSPPLTPFRDSPMSPTKPHSPKDLIASPCRGGSSRGVTMEDCVTMDTEREQAATPTLQAMKRGGGASNKMNESVSAGYDGDREDEGESFLEQEAGYDSDPDVEIDNLWSTDPQWHDSHSHVEVSSYDEEESYYVPGPPWLHQKPAPATETPDSPKQTSPQLVGSMSVPVTSFTFGGVSPLRLGATLSSPDPSGNGLWKSTLKSLTENSKKTMWNVTVRSRIYRDSSFVMSSSACDSGVEHSAKKSTKSATVTKPLSAEASPYFTRSCTSKTHSPSVTEDNTAPDGSSSKLPLSTLSTANQDIAGKTTRSSRKRRLSSDQEVMRENKVRILQDK